MLATVVSLLMLLAPVGQEQLNAPLAFEVRAAANRLFGKGQTTGLQYYDVPITRQPGSGILIKLDYTRRNTTFSFDLHHRLSLDADFEYPAEIITNVEVLSGGTTSIGTFTVIGTIKAGDVFEESVDKVSTADVDRYVTPFGKKTVTLKLGSGSQSISIVGQSVIITRGNRNTRIDTPGQRVAIVSNFKFQEDRPGTLLTPDQ
jgi:hypothetical protein